MDTFLSSVWQILYIRLLSITPSPSVIVIIILLLYCLVRKRNFVHNNNVRMLRNRLSRANIFRKYSYPFYINRLLSFALQYCYNVWTQIGDYCKTQLFFRLRDQRICVRFSYQIIVDIVELVAFLFVHTIQLIYAPIYRITVFL